MTVLVNTKNVYGKMLIYPANSVAFKLMTLIGKKTFSKVDLNNLRALGYTIEVETQTI